MSRVRKKTRPRIRAKRIRGSRQAPLLLLLLGGSESNPAKHLPGLRRPKRCEDSEVRARWQGGRRQKVGDLHQSVGVGALVAIGADRGSDGVDVDCAILIHFTRVMLRRPSAAGLSDAE